MIELAILVVLSLASYRITRFFVIDTLPETARHKFHAFLLNRKHAKWVFGKLYELTSCTWCLGVHVSWLLWWAYTRVYPWDFGIKGWISVFAIAGVQGMIHAIEPEGDHHEH